MNGETDSNDGDTVLYWDVSGVFWNAPVLIIPRRTSTGAIYSPSCSWTCSSSCIFETNWTYKWMYPPSIELGWSRALSKPRMVKQTNKITVCTCHISYTQWVGPKTANRVIYCKAKKDWYGLPSTITPSPFQWQHIIFQSHTKICTWWVIVSENWVQLNLFWIYLTFSYMVSLWYRLIYVLAFPLSC